jgi:hypothetical protein
MLETGDLSKKRMIAVLLNVLSVLAIFLLYLNWLMIGPFFSSVFWAAIISIVLRGLRDWLVGKLSDFRELEQQQQGGGAVREVIPTSSTATTSPVASVATLFGSLQTPPRKLLLAFHILLPPLVRSRVRQALFAGCVAVWGLSVLHALAYGHLRTFLLLVVPVSLFFLMLLVLATVPVNTLVALCIVSMLMIMGSATGKTNSWSSLCCLLFTACVFFFSVVVFTSQVLAETAEFAYGVADRVHGVMGDGALFDKSKLLHLVQVVKSGDAKAAGSGDSGVDKLISVASLMLV